MKCAIVAALATAFLLAAGQAAGQTSPGAAGPIQNLRCELAKEPKWLRRPSGADIARVYPQAGAVGSGRSSMTCAVGADGGLQDCRITEESPPGRGFGEATLALAPVFRMTPPHCKDGTPALGGTVTIPVRWQIG